MPKFLEDRLAAEASKKGFTGKRADRYIYGAMNNMGAMHGSKVTAKGEAMQRKHQRDESLGSLIARRRKRKAAKKYGLDR